MPRHRYEEIADALRRRITSGEFAPGARLPGMGRLGREYRTGAGVVQEAIRVLEYEGLVVVREDEGTFVRAQDQWRNHSDLGTEVRRNELGYIFGKPMGHWPPIGTPSRGWVDCPEDVADQLGISAGMPVFTRYRVVGPNGHPAQITTTYVVEDIARGTVIEQADTGPGGWIDRVEQNIRPEDLGLGPLDWAYAEVTARLPTPDEARALDMSSRLPVLVIYRPHPTLDGRVIGVDVVVVDSMKMSVRVPLRRAESAQWPTAPATARNSPSVVDETPIGMEGDQATSSRGG